MGYMQVLRQQKDWYDVLAREAQANAMWIEGSIYPVPTTVFNGLGNQLVTELALNILTYHKVVVKIVASRGVWFQLEGCACIHLSVGNQSGSLTFCRRVLTL